VFSIIFLVATIVYFFKFHNKVLDKLGLSERDDNLMAIGLFSGVVVRNAAVFLEALFTSGVLLFGELAIALIFVYLIRSRYDRL